MLHKHNIHVQGTWTNVHIIINFWWLWLQVIIMFLDQLEQQHCVQMCRCVCVHTRMRICMCVEGERERERDMNFHSLELFLWLLISPFLPGRCLQSSSYIPSTVFHKEIELSSLPKVSPPSKLNMIGACFMMLLGRPHGQEGSNWFSRYGQWPRSGRGLTGREIKGLSLMIEFSLLSLRHLLVSVQLLPC